MTDKEFDEMVSTLESKYQGRHPALARRSAGFAILGYAGLAFFMIAGLAVCALAAAAIIFVPNILTIKLGLIIGVPSALVTFAILRGLWVKIEAPVGVAVRRSQSPALFDLIDSISKEAGGVSFNEVLLTGDLNAAVAQIPRLGVFGWYKTYLLLGIPLMDALSPEEFKSVLAHEFAHLSHQHGRLGSWIYRLRLSWLKVMASLSGGSAPGPVISFINWFWPRFNAGAFVLSRSQEYQADAFAAKVTSPQSSAMALQRLVVESRRLDDGFWNDIVRETSARPVPPEDVFHRMQAFLGTPADPTLSARWLGGALAMKTDTTDTHPGLKDRLSALGIELPSGSGPELPATRASDFFLEASTAKAARDRFSNEWRKRVESQWEADHGEKQLLLKRLEGPAPTSAEGRWLQLTARARLNGLASVQGELFGVLAADPDFLPAHFFRGMHLAAEDDPAALPYLEKAAERPDFFGNAINAIAALHVRLGHSEKIPALKSRAHLEEARMTRALRERNETNYADTFSSPAFSPDELENLLAAIGNHESIQAAWVAKKKVREIPTWRSYVVLLEFPAGMSQPDSRQILIKVLDQISIDAHFLAVAKGPDNKMLTESITGIEGSTLAIAKRESGS